MLMTDLRVSKNKKIAYNKSNFCYCCSFPSTWFVSLLSSPTKIIQVTSERENCDFLSFLNANFMKFIKKPQNPVEKNINKWARVKRRRKSADRGDLRAVSARTHTMPKRRLSFFLFLFFHIEEVQPIACSLSKFFISRKNKNSEQFFFIFIFLKVLRHPCTDRLMPLCWWNWNVLTLLFYKLLNTFMWAQWEKFLSEIKLRKVLLKKFFCKLASDTTSGFVCSF